MSRPWMPLYVADYLAGTGHLSTVEHGAYMLLIMHYWQKGGLPNDDRRLASIARATPEQWGDMRDTIAEFFGPNWAHERIDYELQEAEEKYQRRAAAGQKGGKSKANKQSSSNAKARLNQPQSQSPKEKEEPNGSSKKRGTRLPDDWEPDIDFALSVGLSRSEAESEATTFREWWPAQPGQKGVKLDWDLTWKTWCRRAVDRKRPAPRGQSPPEPRNPGERAFLKLQAEYENGLTDTSSGRMETGDGRREIEGFGHVVTSPGPQGAVSGNRG